MPNALALNVFAVNWATMYGEWFLVRSLLPHIFKEDIVMRTLFSLVLGMALLLLAGCVSPTPDASPPANTPFPSSPTPTLIIARTTIGMGRSLKGPLTIEGTCVRIQGTSLAWPRTQNVHVDGETFRFKNRQGEVLLLHAGDIVQVDGSCIIRDPERSMDCATPTLEEAQATSTCETGPYFIIERIRKVIPTLSPPPSP